MPLDKIAGDDGKGWAARSGFLAIVVALGLCLVRSCIETGARSTRLPVKMLKIFRPQSRPIAR